MKRIRRILLFGIVVVALVAGACGSNSTGETAGTSGTDEPAAMTLREGDCFDALNSSSPDLTEDSDFVIVDCDGPHDGDVVAIDTTEKGFVFGFCPDRIVDYYDGERPAGTFPYAYQTNSPELLTICTVVSRMLVG